MRKKNEIHCTLLGPPRGRNSCCLWFWQLVFGVWLRDATSNLPSSPNPLSNRSVLHDHDGRKHTWESIHTSKTVVFFTVQRSPRISTSYKFAAPRYRLPCRLYRWASNLTFQRPFNGRSLSRAVIIKTKSLPISATTFRTALSLYIAHDGRKHKHNPTLSANKHVVQNCRSSLSAAADGRPCRRFRLASNLPRLLTALNWRSLSRAVK